uniref:Uncharacterized protein n=1 Tax=Xiphophorus couchianus TaxID=32473 RepID=A0A3B5LYF6_9TELE
MSYIYVYEKVLAALSSASLICAGALCKKQQCTIDRRGFRQELDSWRHKLIHCVGFESILEGLIGPELVKELKPITVSDWSFDENCLFCCLRRDKVKVRLFFFFFTHSNG